MVWILDHRVFDAESINIVFILVCLKESFLILFHPETASLNKKTEIYQGCKHKHFKFLEDCKVTWQSKILIPLILSLSICYQCSLFNHIYLSVMAEESMTKQYCPVTQNILWTTALSFVILNFTLQNSTSRGYRDFYGLDMTRGLPTDWTPIMAMSWFS